MIPEPVMTYLNEAARQARAKIPEPDSSLFLCGILDSFTLVDFITLIETVCGIRVNDRDLRPENFDTLSKIDSFITKAKQQ
jgi:acyl carrier protein